MNYFFKSYSALHLLISKKAIEKKSGRKKIKIINNATVICFLGIFVEFIFCILDLYQRKIQSGIVDAIGILSFISIIYLFSRGKFFLGRLLIVYISTILLTINASAEGINAGSQFLFIPIITSTLILFSGNEIRHTYLIFIPAILGFIFLEYTSYSYILIPNLSPGMTYVNYLICFIASVVVIYIFIFYLNSLNQFWESKLERLNSLLKKKNTALKKANKELDSYVYKTTHDLRAPLTSLMGLFELIKNEQDINTIKDYVALGEKSVHKMDSFIGDILTLSRNSKLSLKIDAVSFPEIIDNTFTQLNYLNNSSQIIKHINVQNGEFYSDPTRINTILINLLANSIRYSDPRKEENLIKITVAYSNADCTISIWDNGIGIETKHLKRVFGMFYRATEKTQGSGLGLYIVKETVEKLNGTITLKSKMNEYTEFTINLPDLREKILPK